MTLTNIISAIGNNSSIYPLIVRDCGIEAPSKILIARNENKKESKELANDATREKIIDEYATSAIWLGGIPAVECIADKFISKKGYNPNVNIKLFKEEQNKNVNNIAPSALTPERFPRVFKDKVLLYLYEDAGKTKRTKMFKKQLQI